MTDVEKPQPDELSEEELRLSKPAEPLLAYASRNTELPKTQNWQDFQRQCVVLFQNHYNDPDLKEFGREGQNQGGIDLVGYINADPNNGVGIQTRRYKKKLTSKQIEEDSRRAAELPMGLKQITFATTFDNDAGVDKAASEVEEKLRSEGIDLRIRVYGWGTISVTASLYDQAVRAFNPYLGIPNVDLALRDVGPSATVAANSSLMAQSAPVSELAADIRKNTSVEENPRLSEDVALHAQIDVWRDQIAGAPEQAKKGFDGLMASMDAKANPYAHFRLLINLGSVALEQGRYPEASQRYEEAFELRPNDRLARVHLALGRLAEDNPREAFELARAILKAHPDYEAALGVLLQAANKLEDVPPFDELVPPNLVNSVEAAYGRVEAARRRGDPDWPKLAQQALEHFPENRHVIQAAADGVIAEALALGQVSGLGGQDIERLQEAASTLRNVYFEKSKSGSANTGELAAIANNAAVGFRLGGDEAGAQGILADAFERCDRPTEIGHALAQGLAASGQLDEAQKILEELGPQPVLALTLAQIEASRGRRMEAWEKLKGVPTDGLSDHDHALRDLFEIDLAVDLPVPEPLAETAERYKARHPGSSLPDAFELARKAGASADEESLGDLEQFLDAPDLQLSRAERLTLAERVVDLGLYDSAKSLLEPIATSKVQAPSSRLLLRVLAESRSDAQFEAAIKEANNWIEHDPEALWTLLTHTYNTGDLARARKYAKAYEVLRPRELRSSLIFIDIALRQSDRGTLEERIAQPIEDLAGSVSEKARLALILNNFGQTRRAVDLLYALYLRNRSSRRVWTTIFGVVIGLGASDAAFLEHDEVGLDSAIEIELPDSTTRHFTIEGLPENRKLDDASIPPNDPIAVALLGAAPGDEREVAGQLWRVLKVKHKFLNLFEKVRDQFEGRFPYSDDIQRIQFDPKEEGGTDELMTRLRDRREGADESLNLYSERRLPLGFLRIRNGADFAAAIAAAASSQSGWRVEGGDPASVERDRVKILSAVERGILVDIFAFWAALKSDALDTLLKVADGRVSISQTTLDLLVRRADHLREFSESGLKTVGYTDDGRINAAEVPADEIRRQLEEVTGAIDWLRQHTTVLPARIGEDFPADLRRLTSRMHLDVFDDAIAAASANLLLISDDLHLRELLTAYGSNDSCSFYSLVQFSLWDGRVDHQEYVEIYAKLQRMGQDYIGVNNVALAVAARIDLTAGSSEFPTLRDALRGLGGKNADPRSHLRVAGGFINTLWNSSDFGGVKERLTGLVLENLLRDRTEDATMFLSVLASVRWKSSSTVSYILGWARGHFISLV